MSAKQLELKYSKDRYKLTWLYERCKSEKCMGRRVNIGFLVPDDIWNKVAPQDINVLCLACFDEYAQQRSVKYKDTLKVFSPITWEDGSEAP